MNSGYGAGKIAQYLNAQKIDSPARYKRSLGFHVPSKFKTELWYDTSILKILKNQMYIGNMVQGYATKASYKINKYITIPPEKRVIVNDTHEPIITKQQFLTVQQILKERRCAGNQESRPHIFTGKLACADCGHAMYKKMYKNGYTVFRCKTNSLNKEMCTGHVISYDNLVNEVTVCVKKYLDKYFNAENAIENIKIESETEKKRNKLLKEIEKLKKDIESKEIAFKTLYLDRVNNVITVEQFNTLNKLLETEKIEKIKRVASIQNELDTLLDDNYLKDKKRAIAEKYKNFKELDYEIVHELIEKIEIFERQESAQKIKIYWKF